MNLFEYLKKDIGFDKEEEQENKIWHWMISKQITKSSYIQNMWQCGGESNRWEKKVFQTIKYVFSVVLIPEIQHWHEAQFHCHIPMWSTKQENHANINHELSLFEQTWKTLFKYSQCSFFACNRSFSLVNSSSNWWS